MDPERVMECEVFMALHPEVDWTKNEILYGFREEDAHDMRNSRTVPKSWWSHKERDEVYEVLRSVGIRARQDVDGDWHINCDDDCGAVYPQ
jgi:hypothetical protein